MISLSRPAHRFDTKMLYKKRGTAGGSFNIITQLFGENLAPFYAQLGLKGHNGIDLIIQTGEDVYAAHSGTVSKIYNKENSSPTIGYGVWITHEEGWNTCYFHLLDTTVKFGDNIEDGQVIGHADNTGQYTLGTHLHFGLTPANPDRLNGYGGTIDPMPYFNFLNKSMLKLKMDSLKNQYLVDEETRIAITIADEEQLVEFTNHYRKFGTAELFSPVGYLIVHGATGKKIKEFFNL